MGLLDILAKKEKELKDKNPQLQQNKVSNNSEPVPSSKKEDQEVKEEITKEEDNDEDWLETSSSPKKKFKAADLLETKVFKIDPSRLVWATHYRLNSKFCARICDNSEASTEPTITEWPIPSDKVVVEIFCQERLKTTTRLLLVQKSKVFPFWAQRADDDEDDYESEDLRRWNKARIKGMRTALREKYSNIQADYILDKIKTTADEFLRLALEEEQVTPFERSNSSSAEKNMYVGNNDGDSDEKEQQLKNELMKYVLTPSKRSQKLQLQVGDIVSYVHKAFPDTRIKTKIVGFTEDRKRPLELENGEVLLIDDVVRVHSAGKDSEQAVELVNCIFGDIVYPEILPLTTTNKQQQRQSQPQSQPQSAQKAAKASVIDVTSDKGSSSSRGFFDDDEDNANILTMYKDKLQTKGKRQASPSPSKAKVETPQKATNDKVGSAKKLTKVIENIESDSDSDSDSDIERDSSARKAKQPEQQPPRRATPSRAAKSPAVSKTSTSINTSTKTSKKSISSSSSSSSSSDSDTDNERSSAAAKKVAEQKKSLLFDSLAKSKAAERSSSSTSNINNNARSNPVSTSTPSKPRSDVTSSAVSSSAGKSVNSIANKLKNTVSSRPTQESRNINSTSNDFSSRLNDNDNDYDISSYRIKKKMKRDDSDDEVMELGPSKRSRLYSSMNS